jgi:uncharacterized protein (UPF0212 family)
LVRIRYLILSSARSKAVALNISGITLQYCTWSLIEDDAIRMAISEPVRDIRDTGSGLDVVNGVVGSVLCPFPYNT